MSSGLISSLNSIIAEPGSVDSDFLDERRERVEIGAGSFETTHTEEHQLKVEISGIDYVIESYK